MNATNPYMSVLGLNLV